MSAKNPTVIRIPKRKRFLQMATAIVEDRNLSWDAKGLMAYLLSRPDDWQVRIPDLVTQSTEGRDAVYGIIAELREAGYLIRTEQRRAGQFLRYEYTVCEDPHPSESDPDAAPLTSSPLPEKPERVLSETTDPPLPALPYTENPTRTNKERALKNEEALRPKPLQPLSADCGSDGQDASATLFPQIPEASPPPKPPRPTDALFDSIVEVLELDPGELTKSARGAINSALSELRKVGATPADVVARATTWPKLFPGARLTASALTKFWPSLRPDRPALAVVRGNGHPSTYTPYQDPPASAYEGTEI